MPNFSPFAVIGATGQQGGAVIDALLERGHPVRALVRDSSSNSSRALKRRGVTLAVCDLDDPESLTTSLRDVAAVFAMTTYAGSRGTEGEVDHGHAIVEAAVSAEVPRVVYSSVGGAERHSGVPHFESKRRIEEELAGRLPVTFVRPTFFMDNLARMLGDGSEEIVIRFPMPSDVPVQMVAVRDIGVVAAALLANPDAIDGQAVEIAGDELTGDGIAAAVGAALSRPARYEQMPLSVLGDDEDRKAMFRWFADTPAYQADFAATKRLDPQVLDFPGWVRHATTS